MTVVRVLELVVLFGAFIGVLAMLWRRSGLSRLKSRTSHFLDDWNGEPARPDDGYEGRPSFPKRMADVEARTRQLTHDFRDDIGGRLALVEDLLQLLDERTRQLQPNGGSHLADVIRKTGYDMERLHDTVEQQAQGIIDLNHRITDVDAKVDANNERITNHRRRNDDQAEELRRYLEQERIDLLIAKQALEASVSELLMVEGHEQRPQDADDQDGDQ